MARRHWATIHRWSALALGAHWLLLALTGMVLVFHREIETAWMGAGSPLTGPVGVQSAIAAAEAALPGKATRVVVQDAPIRALRVFVDNGHAQHVVTVDASSSRVLSSTPLAGGTSPSGIIRFIYRLHQQLLLGRNGELLVGASGIFLIVTASVGLWLGWPRPGQWKHLLRPPLASKRWQKFYMLHRSVGFVAAPAVFLSILSGSLMVWGPPLRGQLAAVGLARPAPTPTDGGAATLPADAAVHLALKAFPGASFVRLDLQGPIFLVQLRQQGEFRAVFGTSSVAVDGRDGSIVDKRDARQALGGDAALDAMFAIHNGEWLGPAGRIAVLLAGSMLAMTALLGGGTWLFRRQRR